MYFYRYTGREDFELIKVRVFPIAGPPATVGATLHRVGPGHRDLEVDGRIGSVQERLEAAKSLSLQYAVPYRVELDGMTWDEDWGRITDAPR